MRRKRQTSYPLSVWAACSVSGPLTAPHPKHHTHRGKGFFLKPPRDPWTQEPRCPAVPHMPLLSSLASISAWFWILVSPFVWSFISNGLQPGVSSGPPSGFCSLPLCSTLHNDWHGVPSPGLWGWLGHIFPAREENPKQFPKATGFLKAFLTTRRLGLEWWRGFSELLVSQQHLPVVTQHTAGWGERTWAAQWLSRLTLGDPMNHSTPGLPVHHQLPEFTQTHVHRVSDAIQPSHPLSSPSPPAPNPSQHQSLFQWVNSLHEVAKVLEFQLQHLY